ncbi:DNA translocase FtsK [bacterium]|nr:MAG: DNA translocase FtsK [bacterium]
MANTQKLRKAKESSGKKQEIIGIILFAVSLYAGLCLFPSNSGNWGGVVGGYVSSALIWVIGYTAYIFPILLFAVSLKLLLRKVFKVSASVPVGIAVFILALSALFGLSASMVAGGAVGDFLAGIFARYFGTSGAFIMFAAVMLIAVIAATGISLVQAGVWFLPPGYALLKRVLGISKAEADDEDSSAHTEPKVDEPIALEKLPADKQKPPSIITPKIHNRGKDSGDEENGKLEITAPKGSFQLPPLSFLDPATVKKDSVDSKTLLENSKILEQKLKDFGIDGRVLEVRPGPVVTMYEFEPAPGIKVNKITALSDDLALALKAMSIRIIAPIPGKSVVGIEVPNASKEPIKLREMLESAGFAKSKSRLTLALGKDISGNPYTADLGKMPHLLVAGATGTGKSVSVNAMILSILYKATPEDVRLLMVDPKMLELSAYEGIPHLITPVITDPKKAAGALKGIVVEMGKRYKLMAMKGAKNIDTYNRQLEAADEAGEEVSNGHRRLPYIVVIIDELADLMMTSGKDVEECLVRLSQMARASGIHLLVATQRPSVDVVTGLIKTNFPARIAFQLPSKTDSRTILDTGGAETLLGEGDMLFLPPGTSKLQRIHGAFVSEVEIKKVTEFWKKQGSPAYENVIVEEGEKMEGDDEDLGEEFLKRYDEAVAMASQLEMISTSYIQRRFRIGYNTAARIIEKMEKEGIVGPAQGSRPREVLMKRGS